jgi:N-acetylneuraminic acid mutarotase
VWLQNAGKMIVWGGEGASSSFLDTGGEFDSATNQWTSATPTAPPGRQLHTAVAAGDQMMIWGGQGAGANFLAGGAVYAPQ